MRDVPQVGGKGQCSRGVTKNKPYRNLVYNLRPWPRKPYIDLLYKA